jgi:hypothetical protein
MAKATQASIDIAISEFDPLRPEYWRFIRCSAYQVHVVERDLALDSSRLAMILNNIIDNRKKGFVGGFIIT